MDIPKEARLLLEKLANSVYERKRDTIQPLYFKAEEVEITEEFLDYFLKKAFQEQDIY